MTSFLLFSLCLSWPSSLPVSKKQSANICKYEKTIDNEAIKNNIDPGLLASVIYVESGFWPHVVSSAGACGLTQVIPKYTGGPETNHRKYTCSQLKNPTVSIRAGAKILSYVIRVYGNGEIDKGLCFYNAGTACLRKKNLHKKLFYVKKVRKVYDKITTGH